MTSHVVALSKSFNFLVFDMHIEYFSYSTGIASLTPNVYHSHNAAKYSWYKKIVFLYHAEGHIACRLETIG